MAREVISTEAAPKAIGTYSQATRAGNTVYVSGQIPLDPATGELVSGDMEAQVRRVFENLKAIATAAGGSLADAARLTGYLTVLAHFQLVNRVMAEYVPHLGPGGGVLGFVVLVNDITRRWEAEREWRRSEWRRNRRAG